MGWLVPYSSLTPEQQQAVMLPLEGHRVIVGGPGAGKTLVLLHRFSYLFQLHGSDPAVGKLFVFTTTLKDFIRSALTDVDVPEDCVSTFDKWCADFYREHVGRSVPWRQDGKARGPDFAAIRSAVHEAVVQRGVMKGKYTFAVVDEGQDLTTQAMEIIAGVARHVTVAMDGKQQLYDEGLAEEGVLGVLRLRRHNVSLVSAFRCNPMVTALAANFLGSEAKREEFRRQAKNAVGDRQKPILLVTADYDDEKARIADLIRMRLARQEVIGILFPQRRLVFGYAKGLKQLGIDVVTDGREGVDFGDPRPKVLTYHEAKGLTFDSVFLPRLDTRAFTERQLVRMMPLMFVGVSRAVKWVCLSTREDAMIPLIKQISQMQLLDYVDVRRREGSNLESLDLDPDEEDALPF